MIFKNRKIINLIITIIVGIIILTIYTYAKNVNLAEYFNNKEKNQGLNENAEIIHKAKETFIFAQVIEDGPYYNDYSNNKEKVGIFRKDEIVEILRDRSYQWYLVEAKDGRKGWISNINLIIPDDPETNKEQMTTDEIENFVNGKGLKSDTEHLIWVDIDRQLTHVFSGEKGDWRLYRSMLSSTGKNISPTIKGLYKIQERGTWFYTERLKSGAKYWVRFNGSYLFHSLPMDKKGNITDNTLGKRASAGCIRLSLEDSQWFYENIKTNSTVFIN